MMKKLHILVLMYLASRNCFNVTPRFWVCRVHGKGGPGSRKC